MRLAMLAFRHLPDGEREGWQALFAHYVFGRAGQRSRNPAGSGIFGELDAAADAAIRQDIAGRLKPDCCG